MTFSKQSFSTSADHPVDPLASATLSASPSVQRLAMDKPIQFIDNPAFRDADAWERFVEAPFPSAATESTRRAEKHALSDEMSALVAAPLLTDEQRQYLFLKMNFLKHEAEAVRSEVASGRRDPSAAVEVAHLLEHALEARNHIVAANTRLIVFVAKKYTSPANPLDDLIGIGCQSLIRAIDYFDCTVGTRFSTYATTSLFHGLSRFAKKTISATKPVALSELEGVDFADPKSDAGTRDIEYRSLKERLGVVIATLPPREALVIRQRFFEDATFQDIADTLGVSKQRVQQMQVEILKKLQTLVGDSCGQ